MVTTTDLGAEIRILRRYTINSRSPREREAIDFEIEYTTRVEKIVQIVECLECAVVNPQCPKDLDELFSKAKASVDTLMCVREQLIQNYNYRKPNEEHKSAEENLRALLTAFEDYFSSQKQ